MRFSRRVVVYIRWRDERVIGDSKTKQDFASQIEFRRDLDAKLFQANDAPIRVRARYEDMRRVSASIEVCGLHRPFGHRACEDHDGVGFGERVLVGEKRTEVGERVAPDGNEGQRDGNENPKESPAPS